MVCIGAAHPDLPIEKSPGQGESEVSRLSTPARLQPVVDTTLSLREETDAFQRCHIEQVLVAHDYNWAASARALDMDSANLHRLGLK